MKILNTWSRSATLLAAVALSMGAPAFAYEGIVTKQSFTMDSYTTTGGETIAPLTIGWESYGELDEAKDNVIFIPHSFSTTSHAAGRYSETDTERGYWDAIIGSGKPIDTDRYYVISSDNPNNLNVFKDNVITTGPATINPATGVEYGMTFPVLTIRDFVEVQKALLESLGITSLHAVTGLSMGALQTFEWASAYPEMVGRIIPVAGQGWSDPYVISKMYLWSLPIMRDPDWNGGDYYDDTLSDHGQPVQGFSDAYKVAVLDGRQVQLNGQFDDRAWAVAGQDPRASLDNQYELEAWMDSITENAATSGVDANHFLYQAQAIRTFVAGNGDGDSAVEEGLAAIDCPVLLIYTEDDLIFLPEAVWQTKELIEADGSPRRVEMVEISGDYGHWDSVYTIGQAARNIDRFLDGYSGRHRGPRRGGRR